VKPSKREKKSLHAANMQMGRKKKSGNVEKKK